jgi:hypothetical protein
MHVLKIVFLAITRPRGTVGRPTTRQRQTLDLLWIPDYFPFYVFLHPDFHGRMARGGHELHKVSPRPAVPDSSMPYWWATSAMDLQPFQGWPTRRAGGLRPATTPMVTPNHTPMISSLWTGFHSYFRTQMTSFTPSFELLVIRQELSVSDTKD